MTETEQELKRLAEKATKGPWSTKEYGPDHVEVLLPNGFSRVISDPTVVTDDDARFIAAANPAAILALLERVKRMEGALRTIARWERENFPRVPDHDDPTKTWAYGVAYGSNGERDFMRNIALKALEES